MPKARHVLATATSIAFLIAAWGAFFAALPFDQAAASTLKILGNLDGSENLEIGVRGVLTADSAGNLYAEAGDIFKLTAASGYSRFRDILSVECALQGGLALTPHNVMLGPAFGCSTYYYGEVLSLGTTRDPSPTTLHIFSGGYTRPRDGAYPYGGLALGPFNRYYGTTATGGPGASRALGSGDGTLYEVSSSATDPSYAVVHKFGGPGDGFTPVPATLAVDSQERLFGGTKYGGANGAGTVFMLQHGNAGWKEQVIYSFQANNDLQQPTGNLVMDKQGDLYGCAAGGTHAEGGVFRLAPPAQFGGAWQETVLYNFGDQADDPDNAIGGGVYAQCGLALDTGNGMIVGTTPGGGTRKSGTIFTLTPPAAGQTAWSETVGFSFQTVRTTGVQPMTAPLQVGNTFYGGSYYGGRNLRLHTVSRLHGIILHEYMRRHAPAGPIARKPPWP